MSLSSTTMKNNYTGNGTTNVYAYGFKIFDEDDLRVIVVDSDGVETVLTKTTDYTVSGVLSSSGGNVTLVNASQAWLDSSGYLKTGYSMVIIRSPELKQESYFRNQGSYFPETHESQFDKIVMLLQLLNNGVSRAPKLKETSTATAPSFPTPSAGKGLYFDADGNLQVTTLNINELTLSDTLVDTINVTAGVADAAKVPRTADADGLLDDSFIRGTSTTSGAATGSKPVRTHSDGFLVPSLLSRRYFIDERTATGSIGFGSSGFELCDTSGGSIVLTDTTSTTIAGRVLIFYKSTSDAYTVTFDPYSSKTIDGASTAVMCATEDEVRACICDSDGNWTTIYHYVPHRVTSFTPSWTNLAVGTGGSAANTGAWWRQGKFMCGYARAILGTSGASVGTSPRFDIPGGYTYDTTIGSQGAIYPVGIVGIHDSGTAFYNGACYVTINDIYAMASTWTGSYSTPTNVTGAIPMTWAAGDILYVEFKIPITEWSY